MTAISDQMFACFWASRYHRCSVSYRHFRCCTSIIRCSTLIWFDEFFFDDFFDNMFSVSCLYRAYNHLLSLQTRHIGTMMVKCWICVEEGGPTLSQHWFNVLCLLEYALIFTSIPLNDVINSEFPTRTDE